MCMRFYLTLGSVGWMICASQPPLQKLSAAELPRTTAESCAAIRGYFARYGHYSVSPTDMSAGCYMRITAEAWRSGPFNQYLMESGWQRDTSGETAAVPTNFTWLTPSTRCTIEEIPNYDRLFVSRALDRFTGEAMLDYKINCYPK